MQHFSLFLQKRSTHPTNNIHNRQGNDSHFF
jgi:hypothetical protein